jgi:putative intracellular protease/amidase
VRTLSHLGTPILLALVLLAGAFAVSSPAGAAAAKRYVCPPCGAACDTTVYDAPGICPACGMTLVEAGSTASKAAAPVEATDAKRVAILVFNGVEILDFTGPYEMFGAAGCDVYTVAATKDPVSTAMGMTVVPKYAFADAPQPDVLVVPGGGVYAASQDKETLGYVKSTTAKAEITMSVCNGAFILANAGLLDGLTATTTYHNIPRLASEYPKTKVVGDQRYVDNGKIITTAGLSAGMDGALHVIARLYGTGYAESVALGEEYDWTPTGGFARASLADHQIPAVEMDSMGTWTLVRTEGDTTRWDIVMNGRSKYATSDLMRRIEQALAKGKWTKVGSASPSPDSLSSTWKFTGSDGKPWRATLKLDGEASGHTCTAALSIVRTG